MIRLFDSVLKHISDGIRLKDPADLKQDDSTLKKTRGIYQLFYNFKCISLNITKLALKNLRNKKVINYFLREQ